MLLWHGFISGFIAVAITSRTEDGHGFSGECISREACARVIEVVEAEQYRWLKLGAWKCVLVVATLLLAARARNFFLRRGWFCSARVVPLDAR